MKDVCGIGNAILDMVFTVDDDFLESHQLSKGNMILIDDATMGALLEGSDSPRISSGGSVANTLYGITGLGGSCTFIGQVKDDNVGLGYIKNMEENGIDCPVMPVTSGLPSGCCLVFVTPDGERTMATYLGSAAMIAQNNVPETDIKNAKVTYGEGYLWGADHTKEACFYALNMAQRHGNKSAFTLSDSFVVDNHRDDLWTWIEGGNVDILFANEQEAFSLLKTDSINAVVDAFKEKSMVTAITMSDKGSIIVNHGSITEVSAVKTDVVDTTGAGDAYAAGVLYGLTHGLPDGESGEMASKLASQTISQYGARA